MAAVMGELLAVRIKDSGAVDIARAIVVPMPMPWQRRLYRGIDHTATLARHTARSLGVPMIHLLAKSNGPPQVSLTATDRQRMPATRIRTRWRAGGWSLQGLDVVLVDDVRTTGGSLRVAARAISRLRPRQIVAAVLAVSDDRHRVALEEAVRTSSPAGEQMRTPPPAGAPQPSGQAAAGGRGLLGSTDLPASQIAKQSS
jgi:predicted amidophosphoribosyltransferase